MADSNRPRMLLLVADSDRPGMLMVTADSYWPRVLLAMAVAPSAAAALALLFLRDAPPTAPSHSAAHHADTFRAGLGKLRRNTAYWVLCVR